MDTRDQIELVGKLLLAAFCGGFIGWQRDRHRYAAGSRPASIASSTGGTTSRCERASSQPLSVVAPRMIPPPRSAHAPGRSP